MYREQRELGLEGSEARPPSVLSEHPGHCTVTFNEDFANLLDGTSRRLTSTLPDASVTTLQLMVFAQRTGAKGGENALERARGPSILCPQLFHRNP